MKKLVVFACIISSLAGGMQVCGACPSSDLNSDCEVNLEDLAILASEWLTTYSNTDLSNMASEWLTQGYPEDPAKMVWVSIDDSGVDDTGDGVPDHEPFNDEMSKYETTNAQYCHFLNEALASGDITVGAYNVVYGADGSNGGADFVGEIYFDTYDASTSSQITFDGSTFSVRSRDSYDMSNHPVVNVSWYGATAFASYYGYRLPAEWQWQAVADYDGSYIYGCGTTIDQSKANYDDANPLGLPSKPYTSPVDYYPSYGYGMNDIAGNVSEWTSTVIIVAQSSSYRVIRGGGYANSGIKCTVSYRNLIFPDKTYRFIGFRVCRNCVGPENMVYETIPAGTFQMGDSFSEGYSDELPVHTVTLSSFKMSKCEITNSQYAEFLNSVYPSQIKEVEGAIYAVSDTSNSYPYFSTYSANVNSSIRFSGGVFTLISKGGRTMANDPVITVSWYGAKAFCDYYGLRLPTEAEWEYAARGGLAGSRFPWGDTIAHDQANYLSSSSYSYDISITRGYHPIWYTPSYYTAPVGSFPGNGYGLHDMASNVREWCADWYNSNYYFTSTSNNPTGPTTGSSHVNRGGSWASNAKNCRTAKREGDYPDTRSSYIGFRVCLD